MTSKFSLADLVEDSAEDKKKLDQARRLTNARHMAWVMRNSDQEGGAVWRPKTVHHRGTCKFLKEFDNILLRGTSCGGLVFVKHDDTQAVWRPENWRDWPTLTATLDQGPKCVAGASVLRHSVLRVGNIRRD